MEEKKEATTKIRMVTDEKGGDGKPLLKGQAYELPEASAFHWLKRGRATRVEDEHRQADEQAGGPEDPEKMKKDEIVAELKELGYDVDESALKADLAKALAKARKG